MKPCLRAYRLLLRTVVELFELFPPRRVEREEVDLRKGLYEPPDEIDQGTIWVHGASLGEVITLRPLYRALVKRFGRERILGTATTFDGLKQLRRDGLVGHATMLPIELPEIFGPFVERMRPALVLISETEIWPLMPALLADRNIPCGIVNARINPKTVRFLSLFKPLFGDSLRSLRFVFPQTPVYQNRYRSLGIPGSCIKVLGSYKYDIEESVPDLEALRQRFGIHRGRPLLTFGSTHAGEEEMILDALEPLWRRLEPEIVIAPRHLDRLRDVEALLDSRHIDYKRLSDHDRKPGHVLLVDQLGVLRNLYAISDLAFVGGSLIKRGGHNFLEPAAYGVPILTGPNLDNFAEEEKSFDAANALWKVADTAALRDRIAAFADDPAPFRASGLRARDALHRLSGASRRTLDTLDEMGLLPAWPRPS